MSLATTHRGRGSNVGVDRVSGRGSGRVRWGSVSAVAGAALLVIVVNAWGRALQADGHRLFMNVPPLVGRLDPRFSWAGIGAIALVPVAVVVGPRVAARAPWRWVLVATFVGAAAWAVALGLTEGAVGLVRSPSSSRDYLASVPLIHDPLTFLGTFVDRIDTFTTHVRAHPPGMALVAWWLDRLGGGPSMFAATEILLGASAMPAVLIAVREVSTEDAARAVAPFLAFAPAAVTLASSGDAAFLGVGAWSVALVVLATGRRRGRVPLAAGGGLLFGVLAFLSYGLVLLAAIPLAVAARRRSVDVIGIAVVGAAPIFVAFLAAGFWWVDGLLATRVEYLQSVARTRPYHYFVVANLAAFAIGVGPAAIAALARWTRAADVWTLVGGALVAVGLANASGMSKAEVERIWLPFVPWVLAATAMLPPNTRRVWLALNVAAAVALEVVVTRPW